MKAKLIMNRSLRKKLDIISCRNTIIEALSFRATKRRASRVTNWLTSRKLCWVGTTICPRVRTRWTSQFYPPSCKDAEGSLARREPPNIRTWPIRTPQISTHKQKSMNKLLWKCNKDRAGTKEETNLEKVVSVSAFDVINLLLSFSIYFTCFSVFKWSYLPFP